MFKDLFKGLLKEPGRTNVGFLLIKESELGDYPAKIRLTVASLLQSAEAVAEEYGGAGDWTLGIHMQNKLSTAVLYNECWLRVPLYGLASLKPGFGTLATPLDGPVTEHRAKWKGVYICAYLALSEELK